MSSKFKKTELEDLKLTDEEIKKIIAVNNEDELEVIREFIYTFSKLNFMLNDTQV